MTKTDKSKHNICVAPIKRSTFKPYNYRWTKFYESNDEFSYLDLELNLLEEELIICSMVIDSDNYSVLTTQRLITNEKGIKSIGDTTGAILKRTGDFKGLNKESVTFGFLKLEIGTEIKYFIETGKASMIMVHGIRTLIKTQQMTVKNIENVTRAWSKQNNN
ncbi:hypothetical protein MHTCC0001_34010 [Flavobacteriaceae bacterium MHTCC 0001]